MELDKEYPDPKQPGWEDQYKYAKALEQASSVFINFLLRLENEGNELSERIKKGPDSIEES